MTPWATRNTAVTVAAIVQAATANGTTTAADWTEDQEQRDEGDDHGYQLAPPQVGGEDPVQVTLDRRLTGDERDWPGGRSQRPAQVVRVRLRLLQAQRRADVREEGAAVSRLFYPRRRYDLGCVGEPRSSCARSASVAAELPGKTTVNTPSSGSSKRSRRIVRARSESVPGTASELASSGGNCVADHAPTPTTASHEARTATR